MSTSAFETYLKKVEADYRRGIATEHTYRPALKSLLETLLPDTNALNDPRHIECGSLLPRERPRLARNGSIMQESLAGPAAAAAPFGCAPRGTRTRST